MVTKQQLIEYGFIESSISDYRCNNCNGILVGHKPDNLSNKPHLVCVDCGTSYKVKD
jgi:DNA-directed RNA polymerase subunit RPC12/RpoP